jgi:IPT/TIG domain
MPSRVPSLALLFALLFVPACNNALDPLCGSARPVPVISSLSPSTVSFSEVQHGVVLVVNGSNFVSSSLVMINGKTIGTTVISNQQLQVTINNSLISGPGTVNVSVHTPSGNSGDLGCTSGGNSSVLVWTVT